MRNRISVILIGCLLPIWLLGAEIANEEKLIVEKPNKLEWSAGATMTSNYIWRGLYCGGPSLQVDATIGYAGFYANMWWNIGATDWTFSAFNPELDLMIGFSRWALAFLDEYCMRTFWLFA